MFKHQDLQMFALKLNKYVFFHPLEVVGRPHVCFTQYTFYAPTICTKLSLYIVRCLKLLIHEYAEIFKKNFAETTDISRLISLGSGISQAD